MPRNIKYKTPKMSGKEFSYIAQILRDYQVKFMIPMTFTQRMLHIQLFFAKELARTNPEFDVKLFIDACQAPEIMVDQPTNKNSRRRKAKPCTTTTKGAIAQ